MNIRFSILFILSILVSVNSSAQKGWELGAWGGASWYLGDLNTEYNLSMPGLAAGLLARYNLNHRICTSASLNYGRLRGDDSNSSNSFQRNRNLTFYSDVFDAAGVVEFNFFPYFHGSEVDYYTPYIFGGINAFYYNPKAELDGTRYNLRDEGTEGQLPGQEYSIFSMGLAYGIGWKWDVNRKWSFNIFLSSRRLFNDYLDDVSGVYPDYNQLRADRGEEAVSLSNRSPMQEFGEAGTQRGDSSTNDSYHFIGISLMRYFGRLECPPISKIKVD